MLSSFSPQQRCAGRGCCQKLDMHPLVPDLLTSFCNVVIGDPARLCAVKAAQKTANNGGE